ncbi:hypothetical protein DBR32_15530 [Taibaiella sp. KBW10]|uniref:YcaO-like family protein n=1 Tax=Taibaiella sp. KBW10 TaxID=2153357 RepID=UPI000F5A015E|nr:YcaO-like family protein [Taibaiella sp. KBW10]RQO29668.1 hypothetical protein DBR32_15530 [Taibaiella sp. KBW10]
MTDKQNIPDPKGCFFSGEMVDVRPLFDGMNEILLGRTAAAANHFPANANSGKRQMITGAACGQNESAVRLRAMGELIERVSAFQAGLNPMNLVCTSFSALQQDGVPAIAPSRLQQFHPSQQIPPAFQNADINLLSWCTGTDLVNQKNIYVPALAAYLCWTPSEHESIFMRPGATGLAAGQSQEDAMMRAFLEVIERSACIRSWRDPNTEIHKISLSEQDTPYWALLKEMNFMADLFAIKTDGLPDTMLALVSKKDGTELTIGSACGLSDTRSLEKAVEEALMLQYTVRLMRANKSALIAQPRSSLEHVIRGYQNGPLIRDWYLKHARQASGIVSTATPKTLHELVCAANECFQSEVIAINVTDEVTRNMGWHVYRIIIPNAPAKESDSFFPQLAPFLNGVNDHAESVKETNLNMTPHPFG